MRTGVRNRPAGRTGATGDAGRNLVDAADHNLRITLDAIRRGGPLGRSALARLTGLSEPGVGNILRHLAAAGLVEDAACTGRAARFAVAGEAGFAIGLDLSAEAAARAVLLDLGGRRRFERSSAGIDAGSLEALVAEIGDRPEVRSERFAGCGVAFGAAGANPAVLALLEAAVAPAPVVVVDAAVCAALGELHFGPVAEANFAHLLIGGEVRAGFVIGGRVFEGMRGRAGRLGRMRTGAGGEVLDAVAGTGTMPGFPFPADAVPDAAFGDWLERAATPLLDAVVAMAGFLAPGTVFVGGPLPSAHLAAIAARLAHDALQRTHEPLQPNWLPRIAPANLGRAGVAMGAAALPFFSRLLPDPRR